MKKVFKVAEIKVLEAQVSRGEISYSRMVEIMNERANQAFAEEVNAFEPKKNESGKEFKIDVVFNEDNTIIVTSMRGVTQSEMEDIIEGIESQWLFENKPKRTMPSFDHLEGMDLIAAISGYVTEELNKLKS